MQNKVDITPEEKQMSISGQNWGQVDLNGKVMHLVFHLHQAAIGFVISLFMYCTDEF